MLRFLLKLGLNEQLLLSFVAVIIGLMVGYGTILFHTLIELCQFLFMGSISENVGELVASLSWWWVLLMPVLGGLIVGPLVNFILPGSRGHGVPEVMVAAAMHDGKLELKDGLGKMLICSISIGCGGSVGREGPVIHLGATLASWLGQKLQLPARHLRTMLGCGAAAGIAASFNAPIAGVIFALEVILGDYGLATFSPIVLSSVTSTVVARSYLGDFPAFIVPHHTLVSIWELPVYVVLGLICGITSIAFIYTLFKVEDWFGRIPLPRYLKPALGGAMVGAIAIFYPQVMGVGYDSINQALLEDMAGWLMAALVIAKIIATAITLSSGFSGGVFTPSLFLGAMVGGAFGLFIHTLLPTLSSGPGAYTLVGMGAMAASVLGAPIASILMLFELTGDYRIMLALMVASIVASLLINQVYRDSIYTQALRRKNIDLRVSREESLLQQIAVRSIMRPAQDQTILETVPLRTIINRFQQGQESHLLVVDGDKHLHGIIAFQDIHDVGDGLEDLVLARDMAVQVNVTITPSDHLYHAFRLMGNNQIGLLPVVSEDHPRRVVGILTNHDVIHAYNRVLTERDNHQQQTLPGR
ncbi:MAG: chloride channel protein [Magnetococcales bacterium]|nr:chloride channel protein [Magnetococcales bacterium]